MCELIFLLINVYIYINNIIEFCFNSIIMCFISRYLQENIMNILSNGVTKHPDFWEVYLYPNTPGFSNNFDGNSRIFLSLYLLNPAILFSDNLIHISPWIWVTTISFLMKQKTKNFITLPSLLLMPQTSRQLSKPFTMTFNYFYSTIYYKVRWKLIHL